MQKPDRITLHDVIHLSLLSGL